MTDRRKWTAAALGAAASMVWLIHPLTASAHDQNHARFEIEVVSSPPSLVSGGAARIAIQVPNSVQFRDVRISVEQRDVTSAFARVPHTRTLEGVVTGLAEGDHTLRARVRHGCGSHVREAALVLTNYPASGPMFSGPQQEVFLCSTAAHRANAELGPAIDADCAVERVVSFKYRTQAGAWVTYDPQAPRPADMAQTTTIDGDTVDFIVRWERGTIDRFIYSIAVLSPAAQELSTPDLSAWNRRLIYVFEGGVAIGHYQGNPNRSAMLAARELAQGYALIYSTGTKTGTHYNLELGGETAIMLKSRFVTAYAKPDYTVGVGGSGGGIQQYIYAQNHPGLLDAAVAQYSYPDMITQTIHVGDCELLERWMDMEVLSGNVKWADWSNRPLLEGMNALNGAPNPYGALLPFLPPGSSECINGWRGLSPLAMNPLFGTAPGISPADQIATQWTHYADLINIYGTAADGFAASTWDNVGVQYGLRALVDGEIGVEEFLNLNANTGSWKNEPDMVQEGCPFLGPCPSAADLIGLPPVPNIYPALIDPWSWRNIAVSPDGGRTPAVRKEADPGAIEAAYSHGMVNHGDIQIPVIDWRNYLEGELNMHNSHQSFAARQRLLNFDGDASNQVVWFTEAGFDQTPMAFAVIDEWMHNLERRPWRGLAGNKPPAAVDSCFDATGARIYSGSDAWNGILDDRPAGPCTQVMPVFSTSRIVAGGPISGDIFKCHRVSVAHAIDSGLYGGVVFSADQRARLETIFAAGVCDYAQGDARRPVQ